MFRDSRVGRATVTFASLSASALLIAACGSSSPSASAASGSSGGGTSTTAPAPSTTPKAAAKTYSGVESTLPHFEPVPTKKTGYSFTIGWLIPNAAIPSLQELSTGIRSEVARLGGKVIILDSQLNPQTEVSNFNQLLAQHVSGIISFPLDPASLAPSLAQAKAQGIPVVAIDAPPAASSPLISGYISDILLSRDLGAFTVAYKAASVDPGGTFALLGIAQPIPSLNYVIAQEKTYGKQAGLKFVGEVDSQADTNAGAATAMSAILAKNPKVNFVFTYNDVSGVGAASQARVAGDTTTKVIGFNGEDEALKAIKSGELYATYDVPFVHNGVQAVDALYDTLTKQHLPLPAKVSDPGSLVTK